MAQDEPHQPWSWIGDIKPAHLLSSNALNERGNDSGRIDNLDIAFTFLLGSFVPKRNSKPSEYSLPQNSE